MCSFVLKNRRHLIGGKGTGHDHRSLEILSSGEMITIKSLPFSFDEGKCANIGDDYVMACGKTRDCHLFDGEDFHKTGKLIQEHWRGAMASYNSSAVVIAGYQNNKGGIEFFNRLSNTWSVKNEEREFHFYERFTAVSLANTVYTFGGQIYGSPDYFLDVYKMLPDFSFSKINQKLPVTRTGHRSLVYKNQVIHIGGKNDHEIEIWHLKSSSSDQFDIVESSFSVKDWSFFPECFVIAEDEYQ